MHSDQQHSLAEALLNEYKEEYAAILREMGEEFSLSKGKKVQTEDLLYLIEGKCSLSCYAESGEEVALIYFYPQRLLNFMPSLTRYYPLQEINKKRSVPVQYFAVRAVENCRFLRISAKRFLERYFSSIPLHALIVHSLIENSFALFTHAFNSPLLPASQRICRLLVDLMRDEPPHTLLTPLTYAEISAHLSIHFVTVAKVFKALRKASIIDKKPGTITVLYPDELRRIADGKERLIYKEKN